MYTVYLVGLYKFGEPCELSTHTTKRAALSEFRKQSRLYPNPLLEVCVYRNDEEMIASNRKEEDYR